MSKPIEVVCALIEQHNRVLVTQRNQNMAQALLWEFPGGKLEKGESEKESLVREIGEELGIKIQPVTRLTPVLYSYSDQEILLIPYICEYLGGVIQLIEHRSYQWAELDRLKQYNWCPADIPIADEYLQIRTSVLK